MITKSHDILAELIRCVANRSNTTSAMMLNPQTTCIDFLIFFLRSLLSLEFIKNLLLQIPDQNTTTKNINNACSPINTYSKISDCTNSKSCMIVSAKLTILVKKMPLVRFISRITLSPFLKSSIIFHKFLCSICV